MAARETDTSEPLRRRRRVDVNASRERVEAISIESKRALTLLDQLRADYVIVERSIFARLRSIALLLKAIFSKHKSTERFLALDGTTWEKQAPRINAALAAANAFAYRINSSAIRSAGRDPDVSIVIPAYNHCRATLACLESIARSWFDSLKVEIIVVDDGSSDETASLVSNVPSVRLIRNASNQGLVRACNIGAREARGKYICFLNNDTEVTNAWLDHLVMLAESDDSIGAVGPKLLYPDGRLEAAGGVVWNDGNRTKYGFLSESSADEYNRARQVDYCPGSCIVVRRSAFESVGGFSDEFTPAYYEDADLCFKLREQGYTCFYQPKSEVIHTGGLTWGRDGDPMVNLYQETNRPRFVDRWSQTLSRSYAYDAQDVEKAAWRLEAP